ncbi:MAG: TetR/AcrR family transcriptional regulator C-terminal ligand-binding domain-containing protein [Mycobacterium sp.]|nr:TetR/AcrR family transcriptional regulator C-terminal ligand-binding domain-containing protein [Mycobacterium sp.]
MFSHLITTARDRGELKPGPDPELLQDQLGGALLYRALMRPDPLDAAEASVMCESFSTRSVSSRRCGLINQPAEPPDQRTKTSGSRAPMPLRRGAPDSQAVFLRSNRSFCPVRTGPVLGHLRHRLQALPLSVA